MTPGSTTTTTTMRLPSPNIRVTPRRHAARRRDRARDDAVRHRPPPHDDRRRRARRPRLPVRGEPRDLRLRRHAPGRGERARTRTSTTAWTSRSNINSTTSPTGTCCLMRARLADESGFSLVELLAAMVVGIIVMFAIFGLLDTGVRIQAKSVDSIDATDRGRVAIDQISQSLGVADLPRVAAVARQRRATRRSSSTRASPPRAARCASSCSACRLTVAGDVDPRGRVEPPTRRSRRPTCRPPSTTTPDAQRAWSSAASTPIRHDADLPLLRHPGHAGRADAAACRRRCRRSTCRASR